VLKKYLYLLSPDGDMGGDQGGGEAGDDHDDQTGHEGNDGKGGEGGDDKGEDGKGGDDDKPASTGLTKDDITDILSRVIPTGGGGEGAPKQPERQYTQAEIEQMLNVWKPDASFLKKLGFAEPTAEQLAAVHELRDNLIKQANTMSEARVQQLLAERDKRIEEISGYVSEQRAEASVRAFYSKYGELEPYSEIVEAVSTKLESTGFKAPTQAKVFEEIANQTNEVLKRMNIKVEKKVAGVGGGTATGKNRMASLASGGQGGGEKGQGTREGRKKDMAIFDEVD